MNNLILRIAAIITLLGMVGWVHAQAAAPATGIRILVYGIHYGGNLVYNYKVVNNSDTPFNNFTIGSTYDTTDDCEYPQLIRLPIGWTYGERGETGVEIVLTPASTSQPPNWKSRVYGQQDVGYHYLRWLASRGHDVPNIIHPGQTLAGFSVTIPLVDSKILVPAVTGQPVYTGPDEKYLKGNFKVGLVTGKEVWGTLEREDTTPPTLTVTLSPSTMPANGRMVPITATITVKDDYDLAPAVQLEAIMSNEVVDKDDVRGAEPGTDDRQFQLKAEHKEGNHAGRIYTVAYSATDGSGNKTITTATITVLREGKDRDDRRDEKGNKKDKNEHGRDH
jgi:hypothetical protein